MTEHFQLNQRITHHSGSVWIVRELHRENEFVVPDDYTIECEVAGRGAREVGMTMEVHADYAHQSFRPTPNIATQNPASGSDGLRDEAQVAALAERNELGYCDCGGPMIDIGMGNDPVCRQAVVTCPTARPAWEAKLAPTITNERQQAAEAERRWINDAAAELGTFVVSPTQTTKSVEELDGPFRADGYSIYDDSGQGDGVGQLIAEGDTFTDALAAALSDGGMGDE